MANLFGKARSTITEHISNIFVEGELIEKVVCRNIRLTTHHGAIDGMSEITIEVNRQTLIEIFYAGVKAGIDKKF